MTLCVIAIARTSRITEDQVKKMWGANRDGGGIAYREHGRVQWRKGLEEQEMQDLILTVPLPYIAHFRIASCGGVRPELTHPFPISKDVPLALKGSTSSYVLFHNGHYARWRDTLMTAAVNNAFKVPSGPWSDSRLMAWIAAHCSINILPHFDEKLVAFGVNEMEIYGSGWTKVGDLYVSNRTWEHSHLSHHGHNSYSTVLICRFGTCKKDRVDNTPYCEDHQGGTEKSVLQRDEEKRKDKEKGVSGVALTPRTFRRGVGMEGSGDSEQEEVEAVEELLRSRGAKGEEGEIPSNLTLEAGEKAIGWVRRLNPKRWHQATPPVTPLDYDLDSMD